jgi:hypothetical protein
MYTFTHAHSHTYKHTFICGQYCRHMNQKERTLAFPSASLCTEEGNGSMVDTVTGSWTVCGMCCVHVQYMCVRLFVSERKGNIILHTHSDVDDSFHSSSRKTNIPTDNLSLHTIRQPPLHTITQSPPTYYQTTSPYIPTDSLPLHTIRQPLPTYHQTTSPYIPPYNLPLHTIRQPPLHTIRPPPPTYYQTISSYIPSHNLRLHTI